MKVREIRIEGEVAFVPLTQGYTAIIDAIDVPLVQGKNWCAVKRGNKVYAGRSFWAAKSIELMHRVIVGAGILDLVDHRDGDGLMNCRANLRLASRSQNAMNAGAHRDNRSGFKGVSWHNQRLRWTAWISAHGERKYLGLFDTPEAAHAAYTAASKRLHGDFARTS